MALEMYDENNLLLQTSADRSYICSTVRGKYKIYRKGGTPTKRVARDSTQNFLSSRDRTLEMMLKNVVNFNASLKLRRKAHREDELIAKLYNGIADHLDMNYGSTSKSRHQHGIKTVPRSDLD